MANTSDAQRKAVARYTAKFKEVRFRVPPDKKDEIDRVAQERGYDSTSAYLIALIERDSGIAIR